MEEREVGSNLCRDTKAIGFLDPCRMCVFSVLIFDTDAASYDGRYPYKILSQNGRQKKEKCIEACLDRRLHFTPLVLSVYRVAVQ